MFKDNENLKDTLNPYTYFIAISLTQQASSKLPQKSIQRLLRKTTFELKPKIQLI